MRSYSDQSPFRRPGFAARRGDGRRNTAESSGRYEGKGALSMRYDDKKIALIPRSGDLRCLLSLYAGLLDHRRCADLRRVSHFSHFPNAETRTRKPLTCRHKMRGFFQTAPRRSSMDPPKCDIVKKVTMGRVSSRSIKC